MTAIVTGLLVAAAAEFLDRCAVTPIPVVNRQYLRARLAASSVVFEYLDTAASDGLTVSDACQWYVMRAVRRGEAQP